MQTLKRFLSVFFAGILALGIASGLAACGGPTGPSDEDLARAAIEDILKDFQNPTAETLAPYLEGQDTSTFDEYGIDVYEFFGNCFKRLDYTINDVTVDGDTATVSLTISNVDLNAIVEETTSEFSGDPGKYTEGIDLTADDAVQQVMQKIFGIVYEKIETTDEFITSDVTVSLTKVDGEWVMDESSINDLVSAMYGGISI